MSKIDIRTCEKIIPVEKDLYGIFFEDINRAGDGGLYPEMLRNRSFEDSIPPKDCTTQENGYALVTKAGWRDEFNHGEGLSRWIRQNKTPYTPIPAWYHENAEMELDCEDTLNPNREASLLVHFQPGGRIFNTGYSGIPQQKNKSYQLLVFAKSDQKMELRCSIETDHEVLAEGTIEVLSDGYQPYTLCLTAKEDATDAAFYITAKISGMVRLGFVSLMPKETFMGHGLRKDLAELIQQLHPRFFRFPGGCIVEGFSPATAMYFKNTVGPIWERPSHQLMWHYRTSNGLGFHEYLQFCEDLNMEPLYVFNCGMTCQARKSVLLEGEDLEEMLQDTLNAIEYAIGDKDTKWGSLRARMGHPEPFQLNYLEIGNENWGEDYEVRYQMCHERIKKQYPHIQFIANTHVEKKGLPTDIVDEHYYNTAEFFAENQHHFDSYDRKGPKIFLGELSVVRGFVAQLYGALGEGAFLIGAEQNQDIVKFISYAPLLENMNYSAWFPNLIRFTNSSSFAIPAYYAWKLFGQNRGDMVVWSKVDTNWLHRPVKGMGSLMSTKELRYKNPRWNGNKVSVSHELLGNTEQQGDGFILRVPDAKQREEAKGLWNVNTKSSYVVFGAEDVKDGTFELEVFIEEDIEFTIGIDTSRIPKEMYIPDETNPPKEWNAEKVKAFQWKITETTCSVMDVESEQTKQILSEQDIVLKRGAYNHFRYIADAEKIQLFINHVHISDFLVPGFSSLSSVVTDTTEQVIIKVVNMAPHEDEIEITLDCEVADTYSAAILSGEQLAQNTEQNPQNICDEERVLSGAGRCFHYRAPAYSLQVLRLTKKY
ncbi:MAG: alpha-L-arabinofuranosidase [Clostridiales bacterium]|nr:alpha-L-arabinofuranosidase [Clostridiales bacterium]